MNNIYTKKKIEVKCFGLNEYGQGLFKIGKEVYACSNLLPKEVAIIEESFYQGTKKYRLHKLIKPASNRVQHKCKVFNRCGGCHLLHLKYNEQIDLKKEYVISALKEHKLNFKIDEICPTIKETEYRNKMQVAYRLYNKEIVYGFYEEESHRIINIDYCLMHSNRQNEIAKSIALIMKEMKIAPYDEDKKVGLIRFAIIRESKSTQEILLTIVTNGNIFPSRSEFIKKLRTRCPYISTIVQNINTRKTSVILGEDEQVLFGSGYITDKICEIKFKISSKTFYQVNPYQIEKLYGVVKEYLDLQGDEVIVDAYCGVGTIGMVLAPHAKFVIGVESNKQSVYNARQNAKDNNIKNIRFINEDATKYLLELSKEDEKIDCIILDPPRSGSTVQFLSAIKKIKPRKVIYVSCEAKTLARDLIQIVDSYKIEKKCLVDMFIGTYHVETVTLLTLKD